MASWLHGLYLFLTVFSVGVTAVDMLGLFGAGEDGGDAGDGSGDEPGAGESGPLLSILRYVRVGTYFALGFGPVGLAAEWTGSNGFGSSGFGSLAWAIPGGLVSAWLARLFFRFQHEDVDSQLHESELLLERAQVIVPLSHTNMGKVRVKMGQIVAERYALAEDEWDTLSAEEQVEIVRVTDECVYVRRII